MSGDMPRLWWSPSKDWFGEIGRETFALVPDYVGPGELPEDAVELVPVSAEHVDARALELSYWFGRLQYTKADDLPRLRGLMRERIEELDEQGDAVELKPVSDAPAAPVETEWGVAMVAENDADWIEYTICQGETSARILADREPENRLMKRTMTVTRSKWQEVTDDV